MSGGLLAQRFSLLRSGGMTTTTRHNWILHAGRGRSWGHAGVVAGIRPVAATARSASTLVQPPRRPHHVHRSGLLGQGRPLVSRAVAVTSGPWAGAGQQGRACSTQSRR